MHLSPWWAAILVLAPLIILHELGHFLVARWVGVRVLAFSIGMGPILARWTDRSGVEWRLSLLPIGGYVKMLDEPESGEDLSGRFAFNRQPTWARALVAMAGPAMNILLAWVLYIVLAMHGSLQLVTRIGSVLPGTPAQMAGVQAGELLLAIDGQPVHDWQQVNMRLAERVGDSGQILLTTRAGSLQRTYHVPVRHFLAHGQDALRALGLTPPQPPILPIIDQLTPGGAAARAGLLPGDRLLGVDGQNLLTWPQWVDRIQSSPGQAMQVRYERHGKIAVLRLTPDSVVDEWGEHIGRVGAMPRIDASMVWPPQNLLVHVQDDLPEAMARADGEVSDVVTVTVRTLFKLLSGSMSLDRLSGPIGIAHIAAASASYGWMALLSLAALLSVNLGVLNLLPIPVLDGGHLVYVLLESWRGRPLSARVQSWGVAAGAAVMVAIMLLVIVNDLRRFY